MKPIRILIADDHAIVRDGVRQLLTAQADMDIIGEADTGAEALRQTNRKFRDRFGAMERRLAEKGKSTTQATLEEMDALWDEEKARRGP